MDSEIQLFLERLATVNKKIWIMSFDNTLDLTVRSKERIANNIIQNIATNLRLKEGPLYQQLRFTAETERIKRIEELLTEKVDYKIECYKERLKLFVTEVVESPRGYIRFLCNQILNNKFKYQVF